MIVFSVKTEIDFNSWRVSDIQHLCESSFVRTCDEQPSSLRFDELNAKINKLDQEIFKLQMAQNRNPMATLMDEKQFILLQVSA